MVTSSSKATVLSSLTVEFGGASLATTVVFVSLWGSFVTLLHKVNDSSTKTKNKPSEKSH